MNHIFNLQSSVSPLLAVVVLVVVSLLVNVNDYCFTEATFQKQFDFDPTVPLSHCMTFGPLDAYRLEWAIDTSVKKVLEMRFVANVQRGYTSFGFTRNEKLQLISGYPVESLPCARRLYDNYSPYDLDGNVHPSYPETPANKIYANISHVHHYVMRNLSTTAKQMLDSGGSLSTNVTLMWGYGLSSMYGDACYNLDVSGITEFAQMQVMFSDNYYSSANGSCPVYNGVTSSWRSLPQIKPSGDLLEGELNQNTRMAGLLVGGELLLETGQSNPSYDAPPGFVEAGENYGNVCQSSLNSLKMRWGGFSDKVGGIKQYQVTAGTAAKPSLYLDRYDVKTNEGFTLPVALSKNETIYIALDAINHAGLSTTVNLPAMRVLNSNSPVFGTVADGSITDTLDGNITLQYQQSLSQIAANWRDYLPEDYSSIDANTSVYTDNGYEYAVGIFGSDVDSFVSWTAVGTFDTERILSGLTLTHGTRYFFSVRTQNCAGVKVTASSPGITVDVVSPSRGRVFFSNRTGETYPSIKRSNRLHVNWIAFSDTTSGIAMYEYAIGRTPAPQDPTSNLGMIVPWTSVGLFTRVLQPTTIFSLDAGTQALATPGTLLYAYVKATDGAGNWAIAHSNSTVVVGE